MAISRRRFLASIAAVAAWPAARAASVATFLAARGAGDRYVVSRFAADAHIAYDVTLPARGHAVAVAPAANIAVAVARRPGRFLVAFDLATGQVDRLISAAAGFFLCGHGVFDGTGRVLYATETGEEDGAGYVGVYDVRAGFRRVAVWPTHGVDPHELLCLGESLVVANGGFALDRATPLDPSLVRLDARDGRLLAQAKPPGGLRQVSLRHLTAAGGAIWVAGQHTVRHADRPPLLATWDGGGELSFVMLPEPALAALANYCGSIAADGTGRLCVTSPHGGTALMIGPNGAVEQRLAVADVCGIAALAKGGFLLTGGRGDVVTTAGARHALAGARWDNHAATLV